ncbi:UBC-like protein, partial [Metschnikowia bicuspidata var. bicuspidata NRRL YB-4993]
MAEKRLFREFKQLRHTPASCSNPQILELAPVDAEESIFKWFATIVKRDRHDSLFYYNGQWELDITVPPLYPSKPPRITFSAESKITHPNINFDTGEICLDILKDELWSPAWNLEHLVGAVLMLLDEPEPDSPLNVDLANLFRSDKLAFESAAQYTMWKYNTL